MPRLRALRIQREGSHGRGPFPVRREVDLPERGGLLQAATETMETSAEMMHRCRICHRIGFGMKRFITNYGARKWICRNRGACMRRQARRAA